jgi:hypothetical protein
MQKQKKYCVRLSKSITDLCDDTLRFCAGLSQGFYATGRQYPEDIRKCRTPDKKGLQSPFPAQDQP